MAAAVGWFLVLGSGSPAVARYSYAIVAVAVGCTWHGAVGAVQGIFWTPLSPLIALSTVIFLSSGRAPANVSQVLLGICLGVVFARVWFHSPALLLEGFSFGVTAFLLLGTVASLGRGFGELVPPAVDATEGWRGVQIHKNSFGASAAYASVCLLSANAGGGLHRFVRWVGLSIAVLSVYMSRCDAAIVATLLVAGLRSQWLTRTSVARRLCVLLLGAGLFRIVFGALEVDYNKLLSGRLEAWNAALVFIQRRPFFGFGSSAVFEQVPVVRAELTSYARWSPSHAHNSFLETAMSGGILIAAWLVGSLLHLLRGLDGVGPRLPLAFRGSISADARRLPLSLLIVLICFAMVERSFMGYAGISILTTLSLIGIDQPAIAVDRQATGVVPV